jgi:hypothetical protein
LRLEIAAAIAFPDGSMTAAALRREVFVLDPIADEHLARVWTKRGTNWRKRHCHHTGAAMVSRPMTEVRPCPRRSVCLCIRSELDGRLAR